jgi:hypothetical protein
MKFDSSFAAVWVLVGGLLWDGFNGGMFPSHQNTDLARCNALRQYDPFQRVNHGKGFEPISDEIRNMISGENDQAINAL